MSSVKPTPMPYVGPLYTAGAVSMDARDYAGTKEAEKPELQKTGASASAYDVVSISRNGSQASVSSSSVREILDGLQQLYPDIQISITGKSGSQSLAELAEAAGKGLHVIISQAFLDRMGSSREEFLKCSRILSEALSSLNAGAASGNMAAGVFLDRDKASFWQTAKGQDDYQAAVNQVNSGAAGLLGLLQSVSQTKGPGSNLYKASSSKNYNVASIYSKVARANSKAGVRAAMSTARRKIVSLQMSASFGDAKDVVKARAAVRSLNKLLVRGERKIRKLDKEQLLSIRKKRAQAREEARKARELEKEQASQKRRRKSDDNHIMQEGQRERRYINSRGYAYGSYTPPAPSADVSVNVSDIGSIQTADLGVSVSGVVVSAQISF